MADNPAFNALLERMRVMHAKKNHDYAKDDNPYSNFEFAGQLGLMFAHTGRPADVAFAVLLGVKLARRAELTDLGNGKVAQNESVEDTEFDQAMYDALWASYRMREGGQ